MKHFLLGLFLFCITVKAFAQTPFITNFAPDVYKAASQNWAVVQDNRGVLYFGNSDGVLEYDGISWQIIKTPSIVRSLAMDSAGRIYVGIAGDFGYLHPDRLGSYQYKSLKEKIPSQEREFNNVIKIYVAQNRIFFQTAEKIFVLQNEKFKVIQPKESFHFSFMVNQTFYVREQGKGLMQFEHDGLQLLDGGDRFANEKIYEILPYKKDEILIVTRTQGIWIYAQLKKEFYKPAGFETVDKYLIHHPVYCAIILKNASVALGTLTGGIIVINPRGDVQSIYNIEAGLQDNSIYSLYSDRQQQLWVCTSKGISLVQNNLPFQKFTEKNGLMGTPMCINYFNNRLYVSTTQYLCVQNLNGYFETVAGTESQNWQLYPIKGKLLLAHNNGLYEIKDKQAFPLITNTGFVNLCPLNDSPDYVLASSVSGIYLLEYKLNTWKIKNLIKGFTKIAYKIVQDKDGCFWVYTNPELYRMKLNERMDSVISVKKCTLPTNNDIPFRLNSGEVVFCAGKGIYRFIPANQTFEVHPDFKMLTGYIFPFEQQKNGDIWFQETIGNGIYETGLLKYVNGNYHHIKQAFYKFNNYHIEGMYNFYVHSDSTVYIGTTKGLLQYDPKQIVDYNIPYHTLIRKVVSKDSLLFGGATNNSSDFESIIGKEIPYSQNNLTFHYAASFYEDVDKNLYSYRLIGSDTTWSAWVSDIKKEYTNLHEGEYNFEVRAENQYKVIGSTASYSFRILPPWHRTWWAYTFYVLLITVMLVIIVKAYTRRLLDQKEKLEQVVKERTAEISQQKEEIQSHKEELQSFNQELSATNEELYKQREELEAALIKLKEFQNQLIQSEKMASLGTLASGVAHEINNPLNFIHGGVLYIESYLKENFPERFEEVRSVIDGINTGVERTAAIVRSLNQYGTSDNTLVSECNLHDIIDHCLIMIHDQYPNRIEVQKHYTGKQYSFKGNEGKLHQAFLNILANAVQAIEGKGKVTIHTEIVKKEIQISITDNGPGIEQVNLKKIFDPFYTTKDPDKGTGLGLTITYNTIKDHNGTIEFESRIGVGTKAVIKLPIQTNL